jgi:hypothetical protein
LTDEHENDLNDALNAAIPKQQKQHTMATTVSHQETHRSLSNLSISPLMIGVVLASIALSSAVIVFVLLKLGYIRVHHREYEEF